MLNVSIRSSKKGILILRVVGSFRILKSVGRLDMG